MTGHFDMGQCMLRMVKAGLLSVAVLIAATPAQASETVAERVVAMRAQQNRLAIIADRLSAAAAPWCENGRTLGWLLSDLGGFPKHVRQAVRSEWHVPASGSLFVAAVAPGSAAARAGIAPGTAIVSINGEAPMRYNGDMASTHALANSGRVIDEAMAANNGQVTFELMGQDGTRRQVQLTGRPGCGSRFHIMADDEEQAYADGKQVFVTMGMARFATADDELAGVVAHEMAHNMLQHQVRQDARGIPENYTRHLMVNARHLRGMEEESDRLSVWLLAEAGYRPEAPVAFWQRFGPDHNTAHPYGRLHDPWEMRVASLNDELGTMRAARQRQRSARPPIIDIARAEVAAAQARDAAGDNGEGQAGATASQP